MRARIAVAQRGAEHLDQVPYASRASCSKRARRQRPRPSRGPRRAAPRARRVLPIPSSPSIATSRAVLPDPRRRLRAPPIPGRGRRGGAGDRLGRGRLAAPARCARRGSSGRARSCLDRADTELAVAACARSRGTGRPRRCALAARRRRDDHAAVGRLVERVEPSRRRACSIAAAEVAAVGQPRRRRGRAPSASSRVSVPALKDCQLSKARLSRRPKPARKPPRWSCAAAAATRPASPRARANRVTSKRRRPDRAETVSPSTVTPCAAERVREAWRACAEALHARGLASSRARGARRASRGCASHPRRARKARSAIALRVSTASGVPSTSTTGEPSRRGGAPRRDRTRRVRNAGARSGRGAPARNDCGTAVL